MIIFLYGEDTYRSTEKLNEIKNKFKKERDPSGINIVTFADDEFTIEKFNNAASQSGFLVSKRLIITKNLLTARPSDETIGSLKELLKNLKDSNNIFVFWEQGTPDKTNPLFKVFSQNKKYVQEFKPLETKKLTYWIKKYVENADGQIETPAVNLLISFIGNNLWQLSNELNKLLAFTNKKTITVSEVKELVQAKLDENIFGLADAIAINNKALAVRLLNEQFALGLNEIYILSMIIRQFRILTQLKSLAEQKLTQAEMVKQTRLHPFVVKKTLPLVNKFTLDKLKDIYSKLTALDHKFKSTSLPKQTLIDLFIVEI